MHEEKQVSAIHLQDLSAPAVIVSDEADPSLTAASCNRKTLCVTPNLKLYPGPGEKEQIK